MYEKEGLELRINVYCLNRYSRIRDILIRNRILGSVHVTGPTDPDPNTALHAVAFKMPTENKYR
jgi:hypothetical protein